jgi:hypothetical protein
MENQQDFEQMTEDQLKERKDEMLSFYQESMPYLEAQLSYEKTLTEIEEHRFKRATYQMQWAMMMQSSDPETSEPEGSELDTSVDKPKKLKRN